MTTTIVMHDAHVCARDAFTIACAVTAQVVATAKARSARKAARAAMRAATHTVTKAANAVKVARKEAAEQYASRCAKRAANKAANAPAMRVAKKEAAAIAKAVRAMRTAAILAVRASRAAAKATATIKATVVAIDSGVTRASMVAPATVVVRSTRTARVLKGPTVGLSLEQKVAYKALRTVGRRIGSKEAIKPRATLNDAAKRAAITERDHQRYLGRIAALEALAAEQAALSAAEKAAAIADAKVAHLTLLSDATKAFRATQGSEQKEWNLVLKAYKAKKAAHKEIKKLERSIMGVTPVVQVRAPRKALVAKLEGAHVKDKANRRLVVAKEASYPEARGFRTSKLHPVMAPKTAANAAKREAAEKAAALVAARKAAKRLSREEWELQKAHRQALKEQYMALRVAKVNRICTEVWYNRGIYVDIFLIRACNDSDHNTRVAAMTELLALVGVAA